MLTPLRFLRPNRGGDFVLLLSKGEAVAGGAMMRTGPAQPTAVKLYKGCGYQTVDLGADTGTYHAFTKPLNEHRTVLEQREGHH